MPRRIRAALAVRDVGRGAADIPALEGLLSVVRGDYRRLEADRGDGAV